MRLAGLLLLVAATAAAHEIRADVVFFVRDPAGRPLGGVRASLLRAPAVEAFSDETGHVRLRVRAGETAVEPPSYRWQETLLLERAGFARRTLPVTLCDAARVETAVVLDPVERRSFRFVGPDGPAAGVRLPMAGAVATTTDADGRIAVDLPPGALEARLPLASERAVAPGDVPLTESELRWLGDFRAFGRVVLPDGAPAVGWAVLDGTTPRRVGADGAFRARVPDDELVLISPEGDSIRFALRTHLWATRTREFVLPVPAVARFVEGRLLTTGGEALPGRAIVARGAPPGRAHRTDAEARYRLPQRYGSRPGFEARIPGYARAPVRGGEVRVAPLAAQDAQRVPFPRVVFRAEDERGRRLSGVQVESLIGECVHDQLFHTGSAESAHVSVSVPEFEPVERTVELQDGRRVVTVRLPDAHRYRPLRLRLLDHAGRAVDDAEVRCGARRLTGEGDGWYAAAALPHRAEIRVSGTGRGWTVPVEFTPTARELIVRLSAFGSVRVLLPAVSEYAPQLEQNGRLRRVSERVAGGTWVAARLRPGTYRLGGKTASGPSTAGRLDQLDDVVVAAGAETLVDLREQGARLPVPRPKRRIEVACELRGEPARGAHVVFLLALDGAARLRVRDTTDATGRVSLSTYGAARELVVARLPGRAAGWLWLAGHEEGVVRLELKPTRDLVVRLRDPAGEAPLLRWGTAFPDALGITQQQPLVPDEAGRCVVFDIPVGARGSLWMRSTSRAVGFDVAPGEGPWVLPFSNAVDDE